jgi:hypothetical protein
VEKEGFIVEYGDPKSSLDRSNNYVRSGFKVT